MDISMRCKKIIHPFNEKRMMMGTMIDLLMMVEIFILRVVNL